MQSIIKRLIRGSLLLPFLIIILASGFFVTSLLSYMGSRQAIVNNISEQTLPLGGDNIYSEITKDILRSNIVSEAMANNVFIKQWILSGEKDEKIIKDYLVSIEKHNGTQAFLASDRTLRYYSSHMETLQLDLASQRDQWYNERRSSNSTHDIGLDVDLDNQISNVYVDYRILANNGEFLGVTGVNFRISEFKKMTAGYEKRFGCRIYFANTQGMIVMSSGQHYKMRQNINNIYGLKDIAKQVLVKTKISQSLRYKSQSRHYIVNSRYIPDLKWFLIVEQDEESRIAPLKKILIINIFVSLIIMSVVFLFVIPIFKSYQSHLRKVADTDKLTGLHNRHSFDVLFENTLFENVATKGDLSIIIIDIDYFKNINDTLGHLKGDDVIVEVSRVIKKIVRANDIVARWGGEEFVVLLRHCPTNQALQIAQNIRKSISQHSFYLKNGQNITVSCGVASYLAEDSAQQLLNRADEALYMAKKNGRNRVEVVPET